MELNVVDMESVASLRDSRGYQLLMEMIWDQVLSIMDDVYLCDSVERRNRLVALYEATRWIYERLKVTPETIAKDFEDRKALMAEIELQNTGMSNPEILQQLVQEYYRRQKALGKV